MKCVLLVAGTRPEMIKLAPVYHALKNRTELNTRLCLTGQHREMSAPIMDFFGMKASFDLDVMSPEQNLSDVTSRVLTGMRDILRDSRPALLLVQGDTTSAMASALAAFYEGVPVGHVEAGLRTGNIRNPFPEELNRIVADSVSALHFAPTEAAREALLGAGLDPASIYMTGNTVIDALFFALEKIGDEPFQGLDLGSMGRVILLTAHRRESFGAPLRGILGAIRELTRKRRQVHVVFPAHPNPEVGRAIAAALGDSSNVHIIEPQPYPEFVKLLRDCDMVMTDSGGIQEEAPSLGKPVLVLRETTERPEAIESGNALRVGTSPERIVTAAERLLDDAQAYEAMARARNPYGDGKASGRIAEVVARFLGENT